MLAIPNASTLKVSGSAVTSGEDVFPFPPQWLSGTRLLYSGAVLIPLFVGVTLLFFL